MTTPARALSILIDKGILQLGQTQLPIGTPTSFEIRNDKIRNWSVIVRLKTGQADRSATYIIRTKTLEATDALAKELFEKTKATMDQFFMKITPATTTLDIIEYRGEVTFRFFPVNPSDEGHPDQAIFTRFLLPRFFSSDEFEGTENKAAGFITITARNAGTKESQIQRMKEIFFTMSQSISKNAIQHKVGKNFGIPPVREEPPARENRLWEIFDNRVCEIQTKTVVPTCTEDYSFFHIDTTSLALENTTPIFEWVNGPPSEEKKE